MNEWNMSVLRFLSTLCLLVAVIALIADLTPTLAGVRDVTLSSIELHWKQVAPATFESMETSVTGGRKSELWAYVIGPILQVPTFILFAILSALTGYVGRRRTRVKIYAN